MELSYKERLKIINDPAKIERYRQVYTIFTPESCVDFITRFCYTYDPRRVENDKIIPFVLFKKQEEFIYWLFERLYYKKNGIVDKCRDVGATWCFVAFSVWLLLFHKNNSIGYFTYKESECDTIGDVSTLFGKVRFIIRRLPKQFRGQILDKYMHIKNMDNGTDIAGSSGKNPGRSGRRTIYFKDESAFYEQAESIEAALSETTDVQIDVSTHAGVETLFYRKIEAGETDIFVFNWWDNPQHTQEWYDKKREKLEAEGLLYIFKREIERDPFGSIESIFIPVSWSNAAMENEDIKDGKTIASLDVADEGKDTNALIIRKGNNIIYLEEWGEGDAGEAGEKAFWISVGLGVDEFRYDCIGVGSAVKTAINNIKDNNKEDKKIQDIKVVGWNASGAVKRPKDTDYGEMQNGRFFENAKAQAYFQVRDMLNNTYKKSIGKEFDDSKVISFSGISDNKKINKLLGQLSQVRKKTSASGKTIIDKKPNGTKSPNLAESLIINFAETEPEWLPWGVV